MIVRLEPPDSVEPVTGGSFEGGLGLAKASSREGDIACRIVETESPDIELCGGGLSRGDPVESLSTAACCSDLRLLYAVVPASDPEDSVLDRGLSNGMSFLAIESLGLTDSDDRCLEAYAEGATSRVVKGELDGRGRDDRSFDERDKSSGRSCCFWSEEDFGSDVLPSLLPRCMSSSGASARTSGGHEHSSERFGVYWLRE